MVVFGRVLLTGAGEGVVRRETSNVKKTVHVRRRTRREHQGLCYNQQSFVVQESGIARVDPLRNCKKVIQGCGAFVQSGPGAGARLCRWVVPLE